MESTSVTSTLGSKPWFAFLLAPIQSLTVSVYSACFPLSDDPDSPLFEGARSFIPDLVALKKYRMALIHTTLIFFILLIPMIWPPYFRPFFLLNKPSQQRLMTSLLNSRFYLIRTVMAGIKGHAMIALFRNHEARSLFQFPSSKQIDKGWMNRGNL